jgi:TolA-binding protein
MSSHLSRKEIKRDEVQEFLARAFEWTALNRRKILIAAGAVLVAALLVEVGILWNANRQAHAQEALTAALRVQAGAIDAVEPDPSHERAPSFASEEARRAAAQAAFEGIVADYGSSSAAQVANVFLGRIALEQGDAARARELWESFLADSPQHALRATVELNLVELSRDEQTLEQAVSSLETQLDSGKGALPEDVALYELGKALRELGREPEALATFERLVDDFPDSPLAGEAERVLGVLQG